MPRTSIALTVVLATVAAGCGAGHRKNESPGSVVASFLAALASHDGSKMCSLFARAAKQEVLSFAQLAGAQLRRAKALTCAEYLTAISEKLPGERAIRVTVITRTGTQATAQMTPPKGPSTDIPLVKAGGSWLIGRFVLPSERPRKPISGGPTTIPISPPQSVARTGGSELAGFYLGRSVTAQTACLACHRIGQAGNVGPGPDLTHVGSTLSPERIERAIIHAKAPMPSFSRLPSAKLRALVTFLSLLR
jgi:hypothetical protein